MTKSVIYIDQPNQEQEQPVSTSPYDGITIPFAELKASEGISLRDRFAGQALIFLCGSYNFNKEEMETLAKRAYIIADAMLLERDKK